VQTPIYDRNRLGAGAMIEGPAIVEEETSTTVVHPGQQLTVDEFGNLLLEV
jgi:N-methylhydantoinase A